MRGRLCGRSGRVHDWMWNFFYVIRHAPRSKQSRSSAASDLYKRQAQNGSQEGTAVRLNQNVAAFLTTVVEIQHTEICRSRHEHITTLIDDLLPLACPFASHKNSSHLRNNEVCLTGLVATSGVSVIQLRRLVFS